MGASDGQSICSSYDSGDAIMTNWVGPRDNQYATTGGPNAQYVVNNQGLRRAVVDAFGPTPPSSSAGSDSCYFHDIPGYNCMILDWIEVWDYRGGAHFRGFTVSGPEESYAKSLTVFFDKEVINCELKQGLMALIELASTQELGCERLVICVDSAIQEPERSHLMRDLRWVGFEPSTLDEWAGGEIEHATSDRWIMLGMDV